MRNHRRPCCFHRHRKASPPNAKWMLAKWMLVACLSLTGLPAVAQTQVESLDQATSYQPAIGQPHPDFVLPNIEDGKPIRLSDYRGKKVLLVHFASW